jgi:hypothetical protein
MLCFSTVSFTALADSSTPTSCFIASLDCPEEYVLYAKENLSRFVLSMNPNVGSSKVSVGTPFSFAEHNADIFYFPVLINNRITYLFRVYPYNDTFCGVITEFLASDIEALAQDTSAKSPMYLRFIDNKIIAIIGKTSHELFEYPADISDDNTTIAALSTMANYSVKNVKSAAGITLNLTQTRDVFNSIDLSITEDQEDDNWCTAYALAAIIRTKKSNSVTAEDIMILATGSANPSTSFPWNPTTNTYVHQVSRAYDLEPIVLGYMIQNPILIQEIISGRPCLLAMESPSTASYHSVVLRGWSSSGIWSIWNPWDRYYENYPIDGVYVPTKDGARHHSYTPYMVAYGFG